MSRRQEATRYDSALLILLSANRECHPFTSSYLAHDMVVSPWIQSGYLLHVKILDIDPNRLYNDYEEELSGPKFWGIPKLNISC